MTRATAPAPPATIVERIRAHAKHCPGLAAVETESARIDYARLPDLVDAWAGELAARGLGPRDVVALAVRDEVRHLLVSLGLLRLGAAQVALASRDSPMARARLAARVGATCVIGDDADVDAIPGLTWRGTAKVEPAMPSPGANLSEPDIDAPSLFLTGSGTTGEPKVIAFSQRDLALQAARSFDYAGQRVLRGAHIAFNNSKRIRLYILWQGGTSLFGDTSRTFHASCAALRATRLDCSTMHAADLVAASKTEGKLPAAVALRVGGSRVPWTLRRALLADVCPRLYVSYGATETSVASIAGPDEHDERETVGRAVTGAEVDVVRDDGSPADPGETGEIRIRTAGMAHSYVGDEASSARFFRDGRFVPGDRVSIGRDGHIVVHGRSDDMMILNGVNIFPLEIERALEAHPAVAHAAALPLASRVHGQIPVAAVELKADGRCDPDELLLLARAKLGLRAPRRIVIVDALPRNAIGKVLKRELAPLFGTSIPDA